LFDRSAVAGHPPLHRLRTANHDQSDGAVDRHWVCSRGQPGPVVRNQEPIVCFWQSTPSAPGHVAAGKGPVRQQEDNPPRRQSPSPNRSTLFVVERSYRRRPRFRHPPLGRYTRTGLPNSLDGNVFGIVGPLGLEGVVWSRATVRPTAWAVEGGSDRRLRGGLGLERAARPS
jgi:hypothetical protein